MREIIIYYCQDCIDSEKEIIVPGCQYEHNPINVHVDDDYTGYRQFMGVLTGKTLEETLELIRYSPFNHCSIEIKLSGYIPEINIKEWE